MSLGQGMDFITTSVSGGTSSTGWSPGNSTGNVQVIYSTTENSEIGIGEGKVFNEKTKKVEISPKLYFSFVKSKLSKIQQKRLNERVGKLYKLIEQAGDIGQSAAQEEYAKLLAVAVREQEAYACGIERYISKELVNKYKNKVKDRVIKWGTLEEFPRVIPEEVRKKIKKVKDRSLFDNYYVLYTDYTDEDIQTTKDKIIEKDPILFGEYAYQKDRLYFIADWIDEYCDLTIEKFVDEIKSKEIGTMESFNKVPDFSDEYFQKIKEQVMHNYEELKNTNGSNWRQKALAEEKEKIKKEAEEKAKAELNAQKPWWRFW